MRLILNLAAALSLLVAAGAAQAGCYRCAPIQNVKDAVVVAAAGKSLTPEQVRDSIIRAGAALGWQIKETAPGQLAGTLVLREHTAQIEIPYTASSFSLIYKSSINLNEGGGEIHKNYNSWIMNLAKGVNAQTLIL
jgi:hypothetical protein